MTRRARESRRRVLRLSGGAVCGLLLGGCLAHGGATDGRDDSDGESDSADAADDASGQTPDTNEDDESEEGRDEPADDEAGDEGDGWEDVTEVVLSADTTGWEGVEPPAIAGEKNPTLVLTAGEEYTITWRNADGVPHNLEIRDEDEAVVGELETELMETEGETQSLAFEATEEMAEYSCSVHASWSKRGDIAIEPVDS